MVFVFVSDQVGYVKDKKFDEIQAEPMILNIWIKITVLLGRKWNDYVDFLHQLVKGF